jgi:hypothetical protein
MISKEAMINQTYKFIDNHKNDSDEKQQAQSWIKEFLEEIFQKSRADVTAGFELQVKRNKKNRYIDHLLPGIMLIEMKSRGKDLDFAQEQAMQYVFDLDEERKPKFVMLSDFEYIRLINLENTESDFLQFRMEEMVQHLEAFNFLLEKDVRVTEPQSPVNKEAAIRLEQLHKQLLDMKYPKNYTTLLMTRLVFCFFAENTQIFNVDEFYEYLLHHTQKDGSDLLDKLHSLFDVLNTPEEERFHSDPLSSFPYINGGLFERSIKTGLHLGKETREMLIQLTRLDWSQISPIIFGSMFEGAMDINKRHDLGAHFTSEKNILKVIDSLFLDELSEEFENILQMKRKKLEKLKEFHEKLANLKFLDPACGSGNFLIVAYREIRRLEHEVIQKIRSIEFGSAESLLQVSDEIKVEVSQFYGIEIQPYAVSIARLGMWLMDHLMNLEASSKFGQLFVRLPLHTGANIVEGDALELEWEEVISPRELNFILGNPPFLGHSIMSEKQKEKLVAVANGNKKIKQLDYVAGWYLKATYIMKKNQNIKTALVSTNSITQGQQALALWHDLFTRGVKINFAHKTFVWDNKGANVYVVIIGFGVSEHKEKYLFEYENIKSDPIKRKVSFINEYLFASEPVFLSKSNVQISGMKKMEYGSKPTDGGHLILDEEERNELINEYGDKIASYIRPFVGGKELLYNIPRYRLYLNNAPLREIREMPKIMKRLDKVKEMRLASRSAKTRELAIRPVEMEQDKAPDSDVLGIARVTSEFREYIPMAYLQYPTIPSDLMYQIRNADLYLFGVLLTKMHTCWLKTVGGRLKNDVRYSNSLVYNTFVFPEVNNNKKEEIEILAQNILDIREKYFDMGETLADIYDPRIMPYDLRKAHNELDKAVEIAYQGKIFQNDDERVEFLIKLYQAQTKN